MTRLDLGSGPEPAEGYEGVDVCEGERVVTFDLVSGHPWPFDGGSVEALRSSHFIEHVPLTVVHARQYMSPRHEPSEVITGWVQGYGQRDALVWVFEEAWRVAQLGARFELSWPALRDEQTGALQPWAFADPTHRRFIPKEFLHYLSAEDRKRLGLWYDWRCNWRVERGSQVSRGQVKELSVTLVKEPL